MNSNTSGTFLIGRGRGSTEAGISVAETLVALSIFAVSVSAIGNFIVQHVRAASSNNLYSIAYSMAEQEIENLRAADYNDIVGHTYTQQQGRVTLTLTSVVTPNSPDPNLKSIAVNVNWTEPSGAKNVSLNTIYTQVTQ